MALSRDMPIRDEKRSSDEPQHARYYAASTGGWTKPVSNPNSDGDRQCQRPN
ncbi:hypothetical protein GKJPGBOP_05876 [Streptomyces paromomycinus]|uniref:Uncharacterized protein n=1 Tax=Streptomyces paromomycinus TaxID=92743 RepID=A0A401WA13_STREY|nr:hypothetical protein GKJPGBOP_05876 [Streptomyces paromomycinus]